MRMVLSEYIVDSLVEEDIESDELSITVCSLHPVPLVVLHTHTHTQHTHTIETDKGSSTLYIRAFVLKQNPQRTILHLY